MNIYDLIFLACLSLGQGSDCKQSMLKCVLETRDASIKSYLNNSDIKKMNPDQFLTSQPQADWSAWALDCAQKQKATKESSTKPPEILKKAANIKK